jgi:hypothetical protein
MILNQQLEEIPDQHTLIQQDLVNQTLFEKKNKQLQGKNLRFQFKMKHSSIHPKKKVSLTSLQRRFQRTI